MSLTRRFVRISIRRTVSRMSRKVILILFVIVLLILALVLPLIYPARRDSRLKLELRFGVVGQNTRASRHGNGVENPFDNIVRGHGLGFGLIGKNDAMPQHVGSDALDILGRDVSA